MLIGRDRELAVIRELIDGTFRGTGGSLLLHGEAGVGKTTLLKAAVEHISDVLVLPSYGHESEVDLPYAGLEAVLSPVYEVIDAIPEHQSAALKAALALGPPVPVQRLAVAAATLSVLTTAAQQRPVLILVDDAHWVDLESRQALLFTARRLQADPVVLILVARDDVDEWIQRPGIPDLRVPALSVQATDQMLVATTGGRATPAVRRRLHEASGGNPLALLEITSGLTTGQLKGLEPLPDSLPPAPAVEAAFAGRLDQLPEPARQLLLIAAADARATLAEVTAAGGAAQAGLDGLDTAIEHGVITISGDRISFRHPLMRSAVYHLATSAQRRRAHRALADVLTDERRIGHVAAAASEPDDAVAADLAAAAKSAAVRGAASVAAHAFERSAQLTPPALKDRPRRLIAAARQWQLCGAVGHALNLLDDADRHDLDPSARAAVAYGRGRVLLWTGSLSAARDILERGAEQIKATDPALAATMLVEAAGAALMGGDMPDGVRAASDAYAFCRTLPGEDTTLAAALLYAQSLLVVGETKRGTELAERVTELRDLHRFPMMQLIVTSQIWLEQFDRAGALLDRYIELSVALGAASLLVPAKMLLADLEFRTGNWAVAYAHGLDSLDLAVETDYLPHYSLSFLSRIEAGRGLESACRTHVAQSLDLATARGSGSGEAYAMGALGALELGLGHYTAAAHTLSHVDQTLQRTGVREPTVVQIAGDLVEALRGAGRVEEAHQASQRLDEQAAHSGLPWPQAVAARCRGLLDTSSAFDEHFEVALEHHGRSTHPFEEARTRLCFAERLRRVGATSTARSHLRTALDSFETLTAVPWAERARRELAATGERRRRRHVDEDLTPQEVQIAHLVARGATNREAADSLFISVKTVETHLTRIYTRLGVRSRTQLAARLSSDST